MQDAKTLKTMFVCGRRVHLHESASCKTSFKRYLKSHRNDNKIDPKVIEKTI